MHDQVLTTTGFCLAALAQAPTLTITQLATRAREHQLSFDEFQLRRALRTLVERELIYQEYSGQSTRLHYSLTDAGKRRASKDEKSIRLLYRIDAPEKMKTKPKSKSVQKQEATPSIVGGVEDNAGMEDYEIDE